MELVTMDEAADCLGISVDTVRGRLRRGELLGHYQPTPQGIIWWVEIPKLSGPGVHSEFSGESRGSTMADAAAGPAFTLASTTAGVALPAGGVRALRELIRVLRHEIDAKDQPIVSKDRQIEQLHLFLQQAMRAPSLPGQNWDSGPSTVDSMLDE